MKFFPSSRVLDDLVQHIFKWAEHQRNFPVRYIHKMMTVRSQCQHMYVSEWNVHMWTLTAGLCGEMYLYGSTITCTKKSTRDKDRSVYWLQHVLVNPQLKPFLLPGLLLSLSCLVADICFLVHLCVSLLGWRLGNSMCEPAIGPFVTWPFLTHSNNITT